MLLINFRLYPCHRWLDGHTRMDGLFIVGSDLILWAVSALNEKNPICFGKIQILVNIMIFYFVWTE